MATDYRQIVVTVASGVRLIFLSNQRTPFAFLQKEKYYLNKAVHSNFSGSQKSVACRAFFQIHGSCIRRINPFDVCFKTLYTRASEYRMQALPHCSLNIHYDTYKENLTKNREFLQLRMPIISFILMIFMFDSEMILLAEIKL